MVVYYLAEIYNITTEKVNNDFAFFVKDGDKSAPATFVPLLAKNLLTPAAFSTEAEREQAKNKKEQKKPSF